MNTVKWTLTGAEKAGQHHEKKPQSEKPKHLIFFKTVEQNKLQKR
jgi:hypothetical protein